MVLLGTDLASVLELDVEPPLLHPVKNNVDEANSSNTLTSMVFLNLMFFLSSRSSLQVVVRSVLVGFSSKWSPERSVPTVKNQTTPLF